VTRARRRGLLLLCFSLVCGGLAASEVRERERRAEVAIGPLVPVVVAADDLPAERRLRPGDLAVRRLPERFAPPDSLHARELLVGARLAIPVAAGSYVTAGQLEAGEGRGALRPGQRAVDVAVAGGSALAGAQPGARVDVVVSTQAEAGGRSFVALEDVELLALGAGRSRLLATLRVTARQAVYLAAAANFAQEVRLLVRPPGDRQRVGSVVVGAAGL
jgi:pilus assembly protein CpaB